jgi:Rrf2 family transcriptional regulator, nitric oxide-sensitive transcriptional repressor
VFSSTAEYALRAAAFLAQQPEGLTSSQAISEATKVPRGYLSKILNDLVNAGIIDSRRGPRGGFTLSRPATKITVLDVVNAVDRIHRILECPLGLKEHKRRLCPLHRRMDEAIALVEQTLGRSTLAEMTSDPEVATFPSARPPVMPTVSSSKHR